MTTAQLLARARTLLDESSASFWTDAEIYSALTGGQQEVANYFLTLYKSKKGILPKSLEALYKNVSSNTSTSGITTPSGLWHIIKGSYDYNASGNYYPCRIIDISSNQDFDKRNSYLAATSTDPIIYKEYAGSSIIIYYLPNPSVTANYTLSYLVYPTAISSGVDPTLTAETHEAILSYALFDLLMKDQRPQEAQLHLQKYIQELQGIG